MSFDVLPFENVVNTLSWTVVDNGKSLSLSEETYKIYPELHQQITSEMDQNTRWKIIYNLIKERYNSSLEKVQFEKDRYQKIWSRYNTEFMKELSSFLEIDWPNDCKNIYALIDLIPVCPRYVKERTFFMPLDSTNDDIIDIIAHECCHFLYFEKWKTLFPDWTWEQFNKPDLVWYLSEMVVDPILNSQSFASIFNHKFQAYPSFYDIKVGDQYLMNSIKKIFEENNIENAITESYKYILKNKDRIL